MNDTKSDVIVMEGKVAESLPNTMFRVVLKDEKTRAERVILCYLSGKMRQHFIKILPGDVVRVEITPYDLGRGRIIYRKSV